MKKQSDFPVIELQNVSFQYDARTRVLEDINLRLNQGEFLGLVGPNGSGKSTLIKLLLGLLPLQQGDVKLFGKPLSQFTSWNRIGYVSQKATHFNLGFPATVFEVVSTGLIGKMGLFRWLGQKEKEQIRHVLHLVGLGDKAKSPVGKLSGGQQQRVFIARALVSSPDLLILDEPTVGVDAESVDLFYRLLENLQQKENIAILLVSHDIGVMTRKVSHIACLNKKLFFHGAPQQFRENQEAILSAAYGHDVHLLEHAH